MGTSSRARVSVSHSSGNGGVKKKKKKKKKGEAIGDLIQTPPTCSYPWILAIQSTCSPCDVHTRHSCFNINLLIAFDLENVQSPNSCNVFLSVAK